MPSSANFEPNHRVLNAFIRWIEQPQFSLQYAKRWAKLYKTNAEAAMCEASFWAVLDDCGVAVEPNPDITPDYLCFKKGKKFYVEVTCIQIDTATRKTNLRHVPELGKAINYQSLNQAILNECAGKTAKCRDLDAPSVLAIGTFHHHASAVALDKRFIEWLHTDPSIGLNFDPRVGQIVGEPFELIRRRKSVFTRLLDGGGIDNIRRPLSALLLAGFGCDPPSVLGLLNPSPAREFDPSLLSRVAFCLEKTDFLKEMSAWSGFRCKNGQRSDKELKTARARRHEESLSTFVHISPGPAVASRAPPPSFPRPWQRGKDTLAVT